MFRSSTSNFDRLLEKATSQLLLEQDWASTLALTDLIRGGEVQPKYAVSAIKKRFYSDNPHVALYALQVMESCVKNCGSLVHEEVATKQFMEELRDLVKQSTDKNIKEKILEMIQNWGMAFRNSQKYRIVTDTLNLMKAEGWEFPPVREAEAMFEADVAPEWAEGEVCHRCRTEFGMVTRQHHCRACGQVFCGKCSSKTCELPKFGIEKEVRVCDSCYDDYGPKEKRSSPMKIHRRSSADHHHGHRDMQKALQQQQQQQPQQQSQPKQGKSEAEIKEEEELQLALALSQSEAEQDQRNRQQAKAQSYAAASVAASVAENLPKQQQQQQQEELAPELMRYLNRDLWEQKQENLEQEKVSLGKQQQLQQQQEPSKMMSMQNPQQMMAMQKGGKDEEDLDEFVTTLKTQVEIFVNRMKSNSSRGRSIANDSSVQTLFMNAMAMHSQLLKHIQEQEDKRVHYELLQDKMTQVKDARAALEALREEERERKRREAEEAERQRQIQIQGKLEVMRQKKQEYLQYQRQLALQRMQEQEREMMMRQEQVKQQYMMQQQQLPMYGMGMQQQYQPQQQMFAGQPQPGYAMAPPPPPGAEFQGQQPSQQPPQMAPPPAATTQPQQFPPPPPPEQQQPPQQQPQQQPLQQQPAMGAPIPTSTQQPPVTTTAAYNMQAMATALPPPQPQQQAPPPPQGGYPMPPPPQQQQQPLPQPGQGPNELISFD